MNDNDEYKNQLLKNFKLSLSRLVKLHETFTAFIPFRAKEAQQSGLGFLDFTDEGLICLLTTSIVLTRHISAMQKLLLARYPVQAMILLRALIEAWFYLLMYFKYPDRAEDYLRNPTNQKGKPKYRPYEVKEITLKILTDTAIPHANELSRLITEQYKIACEMVHMSDPLMYASFGIPSGEVKIPFNASSENDKYLYIAYGRVLHVSSAFWLILIFKFLSKDDHPFTAQLSEDIVSYLHPAFELVGTVDSAKMDAIWNDNQA